MLQLKNENTFDEFARGEELGEDAAEKHELMVGLVTEGMLEYEGVTESNLFDCLRLLHFHSLSKHLEHEVDPSEPTYGNERVAKRTALRQAAELLQDVAEATKSDVAK